MGHAIFISNKTNRYTIQSQKYADKDFQIVKGKSQNVSRNKTTPTYNARHVSFKKFFFVPKQNRRPKRKPINDTLAPEWSSFSQNVLLAFLIEQRVSGRDAELIFIATLVSIRLLILVFINVYYFGVKNGTRVFHL